MVKFPSRLKALREQKGMTQEELAADLRVSRSALSLWEIGKREPDPTTLQRLADYFNTTTDYLLGRTDDPRPPEKHASQDTTDEAEAKALLEHTHPGMVDLLYRVKDLTEDEKESLMEHWEWAMKVIEKERERRRKMEEKMKGETP